MQFADRENTLMSALEIQIVGRVEGSLGSEIRRRLKAACSPHWKQCAHLKAHNGEEEGTLDVLPLSRAAFGTHYPLNLKAHNGEKHPGLFALYPDQRKSGVH